jgi:hypothetical protein
MLAFNDADISINVQHYCRTNMFMRVIVLHDTSHPHLACTVNDMLHFMRWKVLDHPTYSLDLPPM